MKNPFSFNTLTLFILAAISSSTVASTTFSGNTNQTSSNDPAPVYSPDITVGNVANAGTPQAPSGTLVVDGGSTPSSTQGLNVASAAGSTGNVTITGDGSILTLARTALIGLNANSYGELNILNGGTLNSTSFANAAGRIGRGAGSQGVVNVSGLGSTWNNNGQLNIGESGDGTLNISEGGTVNASSTTLGLNAGSLGLLNVSGGSANLGATTIGQAGNGTLNITNDSSVTAFNVNIGAEEGSSGKLNVNDSTLGIPSGAGGGALSIATNSTGRVSVSNGGLINAGSLIIGGPGYLGDGEANLTILGAGSTVNVSNWAWIGNGGQGIVRIEDGAALNINAITPPDGIALDIGRQQVSNENGKTNGAAVVVSGIGSVLNVTGGSTIIGDFDAGVLLLADGGRLNAENILIGSEDGGLGGELAIGNSYGLAPSGAGSINDDAEITLRGNSGIVFNHSDDIDFNNLIQGNGYVFFQNGVTTLTAANSWSGNTNIQGGTLRAGADNVFSSNANNIIDVPGTMDLAGFSQTLLNITNAGTINLAGQSAGTVLTVNGNYTGNDGLLVFGTALGDDSSVTDRMIVAGDTAGTSRVAVNNLGGTGAQTLNGIELITVSGASDGEFTQEGRIVAGAWEYHLARGEGARNSNWYLSTQVEDNPGNGGGENPGNGGGDNPGNGGGDNPGNGGGDNPGNGGGDNPGNGGGDNPGNDGGGNPGNGSGGHFVQELRPEGGAYAANLYAADMMFSAPLDDRMGETEYTDTMTGERHLTSLWLKNTGGQTRFSDSTGQLKTSANRYSLMIGGDLATGSSTSGSTWRTGALAGYGYNQSRTRSDLSGYNAKGEVNGYTTGLYATWYGDGSSERGIYVDGLVQYSWFHNNVQGDELDGEKYNSKGLGATLETGYVFAMGNVAGRQDLNWYLQPKFAAIWSGIKADEHQEVNGTKVAGDGNDNVTTRLGLKTFFKGHSKIDDGKSRNFKPFVEATWIHNTENRGATLDGVEVSQAGTRNIGELRTGVEGRIAAQWNITGYVAQQIGDKGYSDTAAGLGLKFSF